MSNSKCKAISSVPGTHVGLSTLGVLSIMILNKVTLLEVEGADLATKVFTQRLFLPFVLIFIQGVRSIICFKTGAWSLKVQVRSHNRQSGSWVVRTLVELAQTRLKVNWR